jgi:ABC-type polysaccharide/polyol phosphate transport system ATPase subunit
MKKDIAINVNKLSKDFGLPHEKHSTVKQSFVNFFRPSGSEKLKALDKISFEIKKGEFFGIIGANGSGKSTLLKILAQIYLPTKGSVEVKGKVSPFIELGVGFNPELTARENVFLNGAILGLSKEETEDKFDEIIRFAELEQFVDQKLKNFSSGMQVRLAFSIAIQAHAGILLVDEVLAVGDAAFQHKCFDIFRELRRKGVTIVFVSHALNIIEEFCDRAAFLDKGKLISLGRPRDIINDYLSSLTEKETKVLQSKRDKKADGKKGSGEDVRIVDAWLETEQGGKTLVAKDRIFHIVVEYKFAENINEPIFGFRIRDSNNHEIYIINTRWEGIKTGSFKKGQKIRVSYKLNNVFEDGQYTITPGVANQNAVHQYDRRDDFRRFIVQKHYRTGGMINMPISIGIKGI